MARHGHCFRTRYQQHECSWGCALFLWTIVLLVACLQTGHADAKELAAASMPQNEWPLRHGRPPPLVSQPVQPLPNNDNPFVTTDNNNEATARDGSISSSLLHSAATNPQHPPSSIAPLAAFQSRDQLQKRQLPTWTTHPGPQNPDISSYTDTSLVDDMDDDEASDLDLPDSVSVVGNRPLARASAQAPWVCSAYTTQGPGWSASFQSNSLEGMYPGEARTCEWRIQTFNDTSEQYIIQLGFTNNFQLVCGMDYLTLYDGDGPGAPVIARLCGSIWQSRTKVFYSSGTTMTAVLTISANSPGGLGFTAQWNSVKRCDVCIAAGTGTCSNFKCQCNSKREGPVCERETAGSKEFTPRSQHAMAYDAGRDMVYITGGIDLGGNILWDMVSYSFSNNKWNAISTNRGPRPRYGHCSFVYNENLYIFGGMQWVTASADIWMYNGKTWTEQQILNRDSQPWGTIGAACVLVPSGNTTVLYVFGGSNKDGQISRELTTYNFEDGSWAPASHRNSVPLTGATGVYHRATNSIYYFGGTTNQTTRNVVVYQYAIQEALWYALPPRVDPFTYSPVLPGAESGSDPNLAPSSEDDDDSEGSTASTTRNATAAYYPPVMYDSVSSVWAPAGLLGDDYVVMFGGMIPYGPGVKVREPGQRCWTPTLVVYDINCNNWTTHDIFVDGPRVRANHTMLIRPPGSAGSSKTNWTAFVFGGYDGQVHNDVFNITIPLSEPNPSLINSCRALRWCSMYDDCMYCNRKPYCSYIDGLCLFDKDKAKGGSYMAGNSDDEPQSGTLQHLLQQQPGLKDLVKQQKDSCEVPQDIPVRVYFPGTLYPGQTKKFSTYIDDPASDILFEIKGQPLSFQTLNVWEGFMNMYWRADHGLTDNTWDGNSTTSSPWPTDMVFNPLDAPVITSQGSLNTSELYNRWSRYSGLDSSQTMSAIRSNDTHILFYANDPRRFSGYYVYSLTNTHDTQVSFSITVIPQEHLPPTVEEKGNGFNMTMLAFFMAGFILAVVLLVLLARKIRRLIEERDQSHQAAEMLRAMDDDDNGSANGQGEGGRGGATAIELNGLRLRKKPIYRVVVGVQDLSKAGGLGLVESAGGLGLRKKKDYTTQQPLSSPSRVNSMSTSSPPKHKSVAQVGRARTEPAVSFEQLPMPEDVEGLAVRSTNDSLDEAREEKTSVVGKLSRSLSRRLSRNTPPPPRKEDGSGIAPEDRPMQLAHDQPPPSSSATTTGWNPVERVTSFRRNRDELRTRREETEGLTVEEDGRDDFYAGRSDSSESDRGVVDLNRLPSTRHPTTIATPPVRPNSRHTHRRRNTPATMNDSSRFYRQRNPARVQPISIEPIPFHGGLVPRTHANLQRYQRHLQRQQALEERWLLQTRQQQPGGSPTSVASSTTHTTTTTAPATSRRPPLPGPQRSTTSLQSTSSSLRDLRHSLSRTLLRTTRANTSTDNHTGTAREDGSARVSLDASGNSLSAAAGTGASTNNNNNTGHMDEKMRQRLRHAKSCDSLQQVKRAASIMSRRNYPATTVAAVHQDGSTATAAGRSTLSLSGGAGTMEMTALRGGEDKVMMEESSGMGIGGGGGARRPSPLLPAPSAAGVERVRIPRKTEQGRRLVIVQKSSGSKQKQQLLQQQHQRHEEEQEFEPGPLVAVNILIVFPGDEGSRRVIHQGELVAKKPPHQPDLQQSNSNMEDTLYDSERRLPPMAIGTTFLPDPVRWWAHRAYQHKDQRRQARQVGKPL